MGSRMSCDTCPTAVTSSVVNLSDSVILRVADGVQNPKSLVPEPPSQEDQSWYEKLKCIDDSHSQKTGINIKDMETLIISLEGRLRQGIIKESCFSALLKSCYRNNPNCSLHCMKESKEFIDCVDAIRLQHIKEVVLQEQEKVKESKQHKKRPYN
ncbi:hypothetical protein PPYR_08771 [Photinus pyralis]|uniref:Uncharacterized protein n=2 Tax=Photinus pyralis TaxID=7054 RepID=A0A5N4AKN2_PHOPY|nr:uncharacterized protein LOC116171369 [Photinus pyralis]KAB0797778.1 hypothetical protein PPYR_08771 [Photinus pyralis]